MVEEQKVLYDLIARLAHPSETPTCTSVLNSVAMRWPSAASLRALPLGDRAWIACNSRPAPHAYARLMALALVRQSLGAYLKRRDSIGVRPTITKFSACRGGTRRRHQKAYRSSRASTSGRCEDKAGGEPLRKSRSLRSALDPQKRANYDASATRAIKRRLRRIRRRGLRDTSTFLRTATRAVVLPDAPTSATRSDLRYDVEISSKKAFSGTQRRFIPSPRVVHHVPTAGANPARSSCPAIAAVPRHRAPGAPNAARQFVTPNNLGKCNGGQSCRSRSRVPRTRRSNRQDADVKIRPATTTQPHSPERQRRSGPAQRPDGDLYVYLSVRKHRSTTRRAPHLRRMRSRFRRRPRHIR